MHVLGFYHEHSRPDRDSYLNIFLENVEANKKHNFVRFNASQYRYDVRNFEFDYDSIMIYDEHAFSKNENPTILAKDWLFGPKITTVSSKHQLSWLDVQLIRYNYRCDEL